MIAYLLGLTVQISVVALAALGAVALLRRRSAALRHWVLAVAVAAAACLPVLQGLVPTWVVNVVPHTTSLAAPLPSVPAADGTDAVGPTGHSSPVVRQAGVAPSAGWGAWVLPRLSALWAAGVALGVAILLGGFARLAWLGRRARPLAHPLWTRLADETARALGVQRPVRLLHSSHPGILAAWGLIRPCILLPRSAPGWPEHDIRLVLRHELAHIARGDWMTQLLAEAVRVFNWFNPLFWLVSAQLRAESERACDDLVLEQGVGGPEYAERLLALARTLSAHQPWPPALPASPMARPSTLERRVAAMLDVTLNRAQVSKRARLAVALLAVAVAVPVAGLVVFAQAAGFGGTVFDPANRATPNVTIVLTHAGTGAVREVKTDAQGRFEFAALPPGEYAFEASRPAFMTVKGTVTVTSRGLQRDLNLRLGELRETVVVVGRPTGAPAAAATPRSVAARPPCEPGEVDAGGHIVPPRKLHDVKPVYPGYLISEGVSGPVTLEGVVGRDGTVHNLKVVSAPHPELARAALDAVGGWLFDATLLNCEPVDVKIGVTVNFVLQ